MQDGDQLFARFFVPLLSIPWGRAAGAWRIAAWRLVRLGCRPIFLWLAPLYRAQLRRVVFIGVTGSCGKTTTKELIAAVLGAQLRGRKNRGTSNLPHSLASTILRVSPWDRFCVLEIAAAIRGERIPLEHSLRLVQPRIGVVTNIGADHLRAFGTLEAIAAEKGKLVAALPPHGTAVLNADDPHVRAMRARSVCRVITYGLASDAMLRAENISASWPDRLSFTAQFEGQSHTVRTQLCGAHWVPCVLAALAVGIAMGVPLATAAQAVLKVAPATGRMSPVRGLDKYAVIRDDFKAPVWSIPPALAFMAEARAGRKIVVIGTISDYRGNSDKQHAAVARQALTVAQHVVFVGPHASKCLGAKATPANAALRAFYSKSAAREYLRSLLQCGDLVLLKGTLRDGLPGLIPATKEGDVAHAGRRGEASSEETEAFSEELTGPQSAKNSESRMPPSRKPDTNGRTKTSPNGSATASRRPVQVVVGLGNFGSEHEGTPHNVGQQAIDALAHSLGTKWTRVDQAILASIQWQGKTIHLVRPIARVNETGPILSQLVDRLGFEPADCILVHDDIDLPLGSVRTRMKGGDGGHKGVRSVLQALGTDEIRRIKIGVGRSKNKARLLATFLPSELAAVEKACHEAARRARELAESSLAASPAIGGKQT